MGAKKGTTHCRSVGLQRGPVLSRGHSTAAAALYTATQIFENMVSKPAPHMCIPPPPPTGASQNVEKALVFQCFFYQAT